MATSTDLLTPGTVPGATPRRRVLATATRLFYAVGIRAVGIDRIIAEAGVAKATFYHHFPTKDALVCAYLEEQHDLQEQAFAAAGTDDADPAELILRVFAAIGEISCAPGFRGCAFVNAAVEYADPDSPVRQVVAAHRRWFHALLSDLLAASGHPDPGAAATMLVALRDGVVVGGQLDSAEAVLAVLRPAVAALVRAPAP